MTSSPSFDREEVLESVVNVVPLAIIGLLTLLFVVYNPWGWREHLLIITVFGLHLVPFIALVPVTYLVVKVLVEANDGRADTAERVKSWFVSTESAESDLQTMEANPCTDNTANDDC